MRRQVALGLSGGGGGDDVAERLVGNRSAEPARSPRSQVVLDASLDGFPVDDPGFPHGAWHHADFRKLPVRGLWPVAPTHGHGQAGQSHRVAPVPHPPAPRRRDMTAGDWKPTTTCAPGTSLGSSRRAQTKKNVRMSLSCSGVSVVNRGNGERRCPSNGRRDPPDPTPALTQLGLLLRGVFVQAVRGVGDDGYECWRRPVSAASRNSRRGGALPDRTRPGLPTHAPPATRAGRRIRPMTEADRRRAVRVRTRLGCSGGGTNESRSPRVGPATWDTRSSISLTDRGCEVCDST